MFLLGPRGKHKPHEEEVRRLHESLSLATSKAKDSYHALLAIVRKCCAVFEWSYGEAWVPSRDGSVLKPGPAWPRTNAAYHQFRAASRRLGFLPGGGLPGRVWKSLQPIWLEELEQEPDQNFSRRKAALACGFRAALALPVISGVDLVAVLVFYRPETGRADNELVQRMASVVAPLGPVVARKRVEVELAVRERQQKAVARLGQSALAESTDVEALMQEAVRVAAETLGVEHCKLLQLLSETDAFRLVAGVGWEPGLVGECEVGAGRASQAGYTLECGEAVIVQDLDREDRFTPSRLLREHEIISGLSVIIHGHQTPYGVLAVHGRQRRSFTADDVHFLQAVANVLGAALERLRAEDELAAHRRHLETLVERRTSQLEQSHERLRIAERLAAIGTLAAGLGHDLGNTILPILCRLDSLEAGGLPSGAREDLDAVRHAVGYLRQLSSGLRLFALDPDDSDASARVTDLREWWRNVSPLLRNALPKTIRLESALPDELPPVGVAAHRLSQAVLNLVSNAAEAIDGEGTVRVSAEAPRDAGLVRLEVADDGRGMTPEVRRHSLDPFFTTKTRGLSTGLGLALVHAVAQSCGGSVDIESVPGEGTSVLVSLPVADLPADPGDDDTAAGRERTLAAVSLRDPRISAYAELLVRSAGIEVCTRPADDPGDSEMWITEPSQAALDTAREYLAADSRRRVVFFGDLPGAVRERGFVFVDRRGGPDAMRRSLRQVVFQLVEKEA